MNKQYIAGLVLVSCLLAQCKKDNIDTYSAGHYVQFTNIITDTPTVSFFFYPNQSQVEVILPVKLVGKMPGQDLHYKIAAAEGTTAPADHFSIPGEFTFKKGQAQDTARITVKNQPDMLTQTFQLALEIKADGEVQPGQSNYARRIYRINNMVSKPNWWNADMDSKYLGKYSEKKFRTFMAVTGVGDITPYSSYEQRDLFLKFKNYLIAMKDKGTPVLEDDGTDMLSTVPLIG